MSGELRLNRRAFAAGALAVGMLPARAAPRRKHWVFDNLRRIGGRPVEVDGAPRVIASPAGPALLFDGQRDALFIDEHPLAGARQFTFEAVFRPDGGPFAQRWFHLESAETPAVPPGKGSTRILFEIRVTERGWYLDAFATGPGYRQAMMVPEKTFPLGAWYHVAQTFDGRHYRSFVDGRLQMETELAFAPQGPGRACIGARMNRVDHFRGAVREARFSTAALPPDEFLRGPR